MAAHVSNRGRRPPWHTIHKPLNGPYELPKCARAGVLTGGGDYFVLELVTEGRNQQLFVPISNRALDELKALVDHMVSNMGIGQTKN
jgi:hypothetical protein